MLNTNISVCYKDIPTCRYVGKNLKGVKIGMGRHSNNIERGKGRVIVIV